jgi:hypothetical protein
MTNRAETSPLYAPGVTRAERHAIQAHNHAVIQNSTARYTLLPGDRQVFLAGLIINGWETDEAVITIKYNQPHSLLTLLTHPDVDGILCRRDVHAMRDSKIDWAQEEIPFWMIDQSMLNTAPGYEGNGFGKAILFATESLVPAWVNDLASPPYQVIARHYDNSRGAEQSAEDREGYRAGWTSQMLAELGYNQASKSSLEYDFGENRAANFGTPEWNWTKTVR